MMMMNLHEGLGVLHLYMQLLRIQKGQYFLHNARLWVVTVSLEMPEDAFLLHSGILRKDRLIDSPQR